MQASGQGHVSDCRSSALKIPKWLKNEHICTQITHFRSHLHLWNVPLTESLLLFLSSHVGNAYKAERKFRALVQQKRCKNTTPEASIHTAISIYIFIHTKITINGIFLA